MLSLAGTRPAHALPAAIAPVLRSTYLGGPQADVVSAVAIDPSSGDILVAGATYSNGFSAASSASRLGGGGGVDAFVARFDSTLTTLRRATYLGGSGGDTALAIAVDPSSGDVVVGGLTTSSDFPGVPPLGGDYAGAGDGFVARLDPSLTAIRGAAYVGGAIADRITGIAIHPDGDVYAAGQTTSPKLQGTLGAAQPSPAGADDAFIARFDPTLRRLVQATFLGGANPDLLHALAIDAHTGEIVAAGQTLSTGDFPAMAGGANAAPPGGNGNWDAFIVRIDPSLTRFLQSTLLGSAGADDIFGIAAHPSSGEIYVTGWTDYVDLPQAAGGGQPELAGGHDCFVARLNPTLTGLLQTTYLGGGSDDFCYGISIHPTGGDIYVVGESYSADLPGSSGSLMAAGGRDDGLVARLDAALTTIVQTTYLGGSGEDIGLALGFDTASGDVFVAGATSSAAFPGADFGAQPRYGGGSAFGGDGFVSRMPAGLRGEDAGCSPASDPDCPNADRLPIQLPARRAGAPCAPPCR
jgi:hypothetical protein